MPEVKLGGDCPAPEHVRRRHSVTCIFTAPARTTRTSQDGPDLLPTGIVLVVLLVIKVEAVEPPARLVRGVELRREPPHSGSHARSKAKRRPCSVENKDAVTASPALFNSQHNGHVIAEVELP